MVAQSPGAAAPPPNAAFAGLPAFCRVTASLKPSADSDIRIEVWLPAANWNGKLQSVGNGAWAGTIGWVANAVRRDEASDIPPAKYPAIHQAALNGCDPRSIAPLPPGPSGCA